MSFKEITQEALSGVEEVIEEVRTAQGRFDNQSKLSTFPEGSEEGSPLTREGEEPMRICLDRQVA